MKFSGDYAQSLKIFDQAVSEFPEIRVLKVFRALTLYNLGRVEESLEVIILQLLDTTADSSIKSYERALRFYSNRLEEKFT